MVNKLKQLLGFSPSVDFKELFQKGAQIIDVRTKGEYQGGHIKGSTNIPLQNINNSLAKIKTNKPIITCCASGMRSASAKSILKSNGFNKVHNGGGWKRLENKIK
ncbi:MAG TPA: rhodanese-like domain-containing protein [Flavobacteriales bacterium]|nr:rhodanese-like domain-containing protein [Flavobacteriales bacterium]